MDEWLSAANLAVNRPTDEKSAQAGSAAHLLIE
jgi:hypothetical protein